MSAVGHARFRWSSRPGSVAWVALGVLVSLGAVACGAGVRRSQAHPQRAALRCTYVTAPDGSDNAAGTFRHPFRTVGRLVRALAAGQVGCLRAGTYDENLTIRRGGRRADPLIIRSFPGEKATLRGRLYLARGADYTTVADLNLDGISDDKDCAPNRCPSPSVDANHDTFTQDNVTDEHTAICFDIGSGRYGTAAGTVIADDAIHDCGALPARNHDHGIYVEAAIDTRIEHDLIYDNADRGIQLYPQATSTLIADTVIIGNGEGIDFSGLGSQTSNDNSVTNNLILDSVRGYNVASYYAPGGAVGTGNVVADNCIGGGAEAVAGDPMGIGETIGFTVRGNVASTLSATMAAAQRMVGAGKTVALPDGPCARILRQTGLGPRLIGLSFKEIRQPVPIRLEAADLR
jgi:hypothetical protein